jgi:hypothetical protein
MEQPPPPPPTHIMYRLDPDSEYLWGEAEVSIANQVRSTHWSDLTGLDSNINVYSIVQATVTDLTATTVI